MFPFKQIIIWFPLILLASCNVKNSENHSQDPYGIIEAEELGGQSDRLINCSEDEKCPEYAQALFWVAADILTEASSEVVELEAKDLDLTDDMTTKEVVDILETHLNELVDFSPPNYDFKDAEFNRGLNIMHQSHNAGSVFASNELGLLFMEQSEMQDLSLAKKYLQKAFDQNDAFSAYNLARLSHIENPNDHILILDYLKTSTDFNSDINNKNFEVMFMFGLETFGNNNEKQIAHEYLKEKSIESTILRYNFETDFGLLKSD